MRITQHKVLEIQNKEDDGMFYVGIHKTSRKIIYTIKIPSKYPQISIYLGRGDILTCSHSHSCIEEFAPSTFFWDIILLENENQIGFLITFFLGILSTSWRIILFSFSFQHLISLTLTSCQKWGESNFSRKLHFSRHRGHRHFSTTFSLSQIYLISSFATLWIY